MPKAWTSMLANKPVTQVRRTWGRSESSCRPLREMKLSTASVCPTTSGCHSSAVILRMNEARRSHICKPRNSPLFLDLATRCYIRRSRVTCTNLANVSPRTCLFKRIEEQDRIKLSRAITSSIRISTIHSRYSARPTIKPLNLRSDGDPIVLAAQRAVYSSSILVFAPGWARAAREQAIRSGPLVLMKESIFQPPACSRRATTRISTKRWWHQQRSKRHRLGSISTHWRKSWPSNSKRLRSCSCKTKRDLWAECTRKSSWKDVISKSRSSTGKSSLIKNKTIRTYWRWGMRCPPATTHLIKKI